MPDQKHIRPTAGLEEDDRFPQPMFKCRTPWIYPPPGSETLGGRQARDRENHA